MRRSTTRLWCASTSSSGSPISTQFSSSTSTSLRISSRHSARRGDAFSSSRYTHVGASPSAPAPSPTATPPSTARIERDDANEPSKPPARCALISAGEGVCASAALSAFTESCFHSAGFARNDDAHATSRTRSAGYAEWPVAATQGGGSASASSSPSAAFNEPPLNVNNEREGRRPRTSSNCVGVSAVWLAILNPTRARARPTKRTSTNLPARAGTRPVCSSYCTSASKPPSSSSHTVSRRYRITPPDLFTSSICRVSGGPRWCARVERLGAERDGAARALRRHGDVHALLARARVGASTPLGGRGRRARETRSVVFLVRVGHSQVERNLEPEPLDFPGAERPVRRHRLAAADHPAGGAHAQHVAQLLGYAPLVQHVDAARVAHVHVPRRHRAHAGGLEHERVVGADTQLGEEPARARVERQRVLRRAVQRTHQRFAPRVLVRGVEPKRDEGKRPRVHHAFRGVARERRAPQLGARRNRARVVVLVERLHRHQVHAAPAFVRELEGHCDVPVVDQRHGLVRQPPTTVGGTEACSRRRRSGTWA